VWIYVSPADVLNGFYWVLGFIGFLHFFHMNMAIAKCYSHQVNPKMENDYFVFMVNYVYCFCTGTRLILLKLQLNLKSLNLNSFYLVLRFGVVFVVF